MPYQVMNFCESTQVAINVFHMFRNGTVNQFYGDNGLQTYVEPGWYPKAEGEIRPTFDRIKDMASMLQGEYDKVRVHDIVKSGEWHCRMERRLVQFFLGRSVMEKTIFSVVVQKEYLDGDEVSGWTAWNMHSAELKVCRKARVFGSEKERQGGTDVFKFYTRHVDQRQTLLSEQMRQNFGNSFVCLTEEESEEIAEAV